MATNITLVGRDLNKATPLYMAAPVCMVAKMCCCYSILHPCRSVRSPYSYSLEEILLVASPVVYECCLANPVGACKRRRPSPAWLLALHILAVHPLHAPLNYLYVVEPTVLNAHRYLRALTLPIFHDGCSLLRLQFSALHCSASNGVVHTLVAVHWEVISFWGQRQIVRSGEGGT